MRVVSSAAVIVAAVVVFAAPWTARGALSVAGQVPVAETSTVEWTRSEGDGLAQRLIDGGEPAGGRALLALLRELEREEASASAARLLLDRGDQADLVRLEIDWATRGAPGGVAIAAQGLSLRPVVEGEGAAGVGPFGWGVVPQEVGGTAVPGVYRAELPAPLTLAVPPGEYELRVAAINNAGASLTLRVATADGPLFETLVPRFSDPAEAAPISVVRRLTIE